MILAKKSKEDRIRGDPSIFFLQSVVSRVFWILDLRIIDIASCFSLTWAHTTWRNYRQKTVKCNSSYSSAWNCVHILKRYAILIIYQWQTTALIEYLLIILNHCYIYLKSPTCIADFQGNSLTSLYEGRITEKRSSKSGELFLFYCMITLTFGSRSQLPRGRSRNTTTITWHLLLYFRSLSRTTYTLPGAQKTTLRRQLSPSSFRFLSVWSSKKHATSRLLPSCILFKTKENPTPKKYLRLSFCYVSKLKAQKKPKRDGFSSFACMSRAGALQQSRHLVFEILNLDLEIGGIRFIYFKLLISYIFRLVDKTATVLMFILARLAMHDPEHNWS